ncbi:hypothetical protein NLR17_25105, partial [Escherichia coli]|nr:hypothetical protein [Escherichia coli]
IVGAVFHGERLIAIFPDRPNTTEMVCGCVSRENIPVSGAALPFRRRWRVELFVRTFDTRFHAASPALSRRT